VHTCQSRRPARRRLPCSFAVRGAEMADLHAAARSSLAVDAGLTVGPKPLPRPGTPGDISGLEVGTVINMQRVDEALELTCAIFCERADRGDITAAERDLLTDGAILLAMHVDDLAREDLAGPTPGMPGMAQPAPAGRHERWRAAAASSPAARARGAQRPGRGAEGRRHASVQ
jgi:hypothetical protein